MRKILNLTTVKFSGFPLTKQTEHKQIDIDIEINPTKKKQWEIDLKINWKCKYLRSDQLNLKADELRIELYAIPVNNYIKIIIRRRRRKRYLGMKWKTVENLGWRRVELRRPKGEEQAIFRAQFATFCPICGGLYFTILPSILTKCNF